VTVPIAPVEVIPVVIAEFEDDESPEFSKN